MELIRFYIKSLYKHYFVVPKNNREDVYIGSTELHISDSLELYLLNKNLLKIYKEVIVLI